MDDLVRFVVAKGIRPPVEKVFGFSKDEAYGYLKAGNHIGEVCISLESLPVSRRRFRNQFLDA